MQLGRTICECGVIMIFDRIGRASKLQTWKSSFPVHRNLFGFRRFCESLKISLVLSAKASSSEYLGSSSWTWLKGGSHKFFQPTTHQYALMTFDHLDNLFFLKTSQLPQISWAISQLWINSVPLAWPLILSTWVWFEGCDRSSLQMFERLRGRGRNQPVLIGLGLGEVTATWANRLGGLRWRPYPASLKKGIRRCFFWISQIQICVTSLNRFSCTIRFVRECISFFGQVISLLCDNLARGDLFTKAAFFGHFSTLK